MKQTISTLLVCCTAAVGYAADWTSGMSEGTPEVKSISQLAFGPEGILLVADTKAASVFAIATGDTSEKKAQPFKVDGIDTKIAGLLGTTSDHILIDDMAVNPISRTAYLAVSRGRGPEATPVLVKVTPGGTPEHFSLNNVTFSKAVLPDAPIDGVVGEGRRRSNPRLESITDIGFFQDRVLIAGLSNEEFSSTFRAIPFPFETVAEGSTVEIFHGAHGRFETRAPVRTFVPFNIGDHQSVLAAYTCTPLVEIPLTDLTPGAKVKGKTVAELGNRNRPLDMIVYQKNGADYLLLANSSRGIMKISTDSLTDMEGIVDRVRDTAGLGYETIEAWDGVLQLDRVDTEHAMVVRRSGEEALALEVLALP